MTTYQITLALAAVSRAISHLSSGGSVTYRDLTRKLRALGCEFRRQSKGSHEICTNPQKNLSAVIPNHPGDIPGGGHAEGDSQTTRH